ncbi:MAG: hypothetical protein BWY82_01633 [Verrucomicrobia bacterium ADurb.Bin474]|nr:MAG: hypothetical protein BWY82_01633 [Verrucomicrobia bacterium ADurb.Bin474]
MRFTPFRRLHPNGKKPSLKIRSICRGPVSMDHTCSISPSDFPFRPQSTPNREATYPRHSRHGRAARGRSSGPMADTTCSLKTWCSRRISWDSKMRTITHKKKRLERNSNLGLIPDTLVTSNQAPIRLSTRPSERSGSLKNRALMVSCTSFLNVGGLWK